MFKRFGFILLVCLSFTGNAAKSQEVRDLPGVLSPASKVYFDRVVKDMDRVWNNRKDGTKWNISLSSMIAVEIDNNGNPVYQMRTSSRVPSYDRLTMECCKKTPITKPPAAWNPKHTIGITYNYKVSKSKNKSDLYDFSAMNQMSKGINEYNEKHYEQAAFYWQRAVELDPYLVAARVNLAGVLNVLERYQDSIVQLKESLKLAPDDDEVRWVLATTYGRLNNFSEARKMAETVGPTSQYYKDAQDLLLKTTDIQSGSQLSDSDAVIKVAAGVYNLGVTEARNGNNKGAITYYKKALELYPQHEFAHTALSYAYIQLKMWTEAIIELKECLRRDPNDDRSKYLLGRVYVQTGKPDDGYALFKEVRKGSNAYEEAQNALNARQTSKSGQPVTSTNITPTAPKPIFNADLLKMMRNE